MVERIFEKAALCEKKNMAFALVTIAGVKGTVPRKRGRMLVDGQGNTVSTIGGYEIERKCAEAALQCIEDGRSRMIAISVRDKGEMSVMIDVVNRIKKAYIIGFGHVGQAVAGCLYRLGYAIYIYDDGPDTVYENAVEVNRGYDSLSSLVLDEHSCLIITTSEKDYALESIDWSRAFYVGAISSRSRIVTKRSDASSPLCIPMGYDTGAETPEEIAVSVAAEVMKFYNRAGGLSLYERRRRLVVVRGAGDLATGTIIRLTRAGYDVLCLEIEKPTQVRRNVSFAEAVYEKEWTVDGLTCRLIDSWRECFRAFDEGVVPLLIDGSGECIKQLEPSVVIDAVIAKKNLGTHIDMAPLTIALGPGFEAGRDVDVVIETKRGHNLGKIITRGYAEANTGVPGIIGGYGKERVIRSSASGVFKGVKTFGDIVEAGDVIAYVGDVPQHTLISGMVRGMLHDGLEVCEGFKIADVDPRGSGVDYTSVSDKARCIAGSVLEVVDSYFAKGLF